MIRSLTKFLPALAVSAGLAAPAALACTSMLVSKGASSDGSTLITYSADSHELYGELYYTPARRNGPGAQRDIIEWDTGKFLGRIKEAPVTYTVVGNLNEHQLAISESTFTGRKELEGPAGIVDYGSLIYIALERAKTAREAIKVMTDLVAEYGYASTGESFSIADPKEVWILEMIGKGTGKKGAVWVARRLPEGYLSAHANQARIRQFPLNDAENALYSPDVISFAREKGWFTGADKDFSFADTYHPLDFESVRFAEARVWSIFRRAAPSAGLGADYVDGSAPTKRLPLWVKPDKK
ncbi:MAG TPA: C69 family dipeptidase, partial [Archangium sp.]|nr:C69 family dipeptidase [Archangium sp.]